METITAQELKAKLDNNDDFKLVCTLSDWHFAGMRIPGSIHIDNIKKAEELLKDKNEEIVVYCSGDPCYSSKYAYKKLKEKGYSNIKRYNGGISEWEQLGYPVEGDMVNSS